MGAAPLDRSGEKKGLQFDGNVCIASCAIQNTYKKQYKMISAPGDHLKNN